MIHLIKDHNGHNQFIDFGALTEAQVSQLLAIANACTRAQMPSVEFPDDSEEKVRGYVRLVKPKRFFPRGSSSGKRDLGNPKVLPFKLLGSEILKAIGDEAKKGIDEATAKLDAAEAKAVKAAEEDGQEVEEGAYRDHHGRKSVAKDQAVLDAFNQAASVLA